MIRRIRRLWCRLRGLCPRCFGKDGLTVTDPVGVVRWWPCPACWHTGRFTFRNEGDRFALALLVEDIVEERLQALLPGQTRQEDATGCPGK